MTSTVVPFGNLGAGGMAAAMAAVEKAIASANSFRRKGTTRRNQGGLRGTLEARVTAVKRKSSLRRRARGRPGSRCALLGQKIAGSAGTEASLIHFGRIAAKAA